VRYGEEDEVGIDIAGLSVPEDEIGQSPEVGMDRGDGVPSSFRDVAATTSADEW
jgi:hypothetical protein